VSHGKDASERAQQTWGARSWRQIVMGEEEEEEDEEGGRGGDENSHHRCTRDTWWSSCVPKVIREASLEDLTVWVDPLDGTKQFTNGHPERVTVLIGLALKGVPIAGVVHQPFGVPKSRTFAAVIGAGGFIRECGVTPHGGQGGQPSSSVGEGFRPIDETDLNTWNPYRAQGLNKDGKIVVATTGSHASPAVEAAAKRMNPDQILAIGGAGNKVLLLLDGVISHYVFAGNGTKRWDTLAPEALLYALGGFMTDLQGNHYDYSFPKDIPPHQADVEQYKNMRGLVAGLSTGAWRILGERMGGQFAARASPLSPTELLLLNPKEEC